MKFLIPETALEVYGFWLNYCSVTERKIQNIIGTQYCEKNNAFYNHVPGNVSHLG